MISHDISRFDIFLFGTCAIITCSWLLNPIWKWTMDFWPIIWNFSHFTTHNACNINCTLLQKSGLKKYKPRVIMAPVQNNVWLIKFCTKTGTVLLLCLLQNLMKQTLQQSFYFSMMNKFYLSLIIMTWSWNLVNLAK